MVTEEVKIFLVTSVMGIHVNLTPCFHEIRKQQILFYYDDLEVVNPLGSQYKCTQIW